MGNLVTAKRVIRLVKELERIEAELASVSFPARGNEQKKASGAVRKSLKFARAVRGLDPETRQELTHLKEKNGAQYAIELADQMKRKPHVQHS